MLVLSRKKDETIVIGGQIELQVLKIKGNSVRIGIKAPEHVKILRGEVSPFDVTFEVAMEEFEKIRDEAKELSPAEEAAPPKKSATIVTHVSAIKDENDPGLPNPFAIV